MASKQVIPPKTVVTKTPVTPITKPVVNPPKPPSVGSVQSVINRGSASGYDGGLSKGNYRVEVGGKVIDTGNATTLANLLKQGGKITMSPGQQKQPVFDEAKFREDMLNQQKGMIDNFYNQQKASQLAQMQASRDKAVGQLNQQRQTIAPEYANKRNQSDVVNAQNVQRLREMMAANGLQASGENVSANVAMNNERANSINSLNLQEQQTYNDIDRRVADLYNPADENALVAALESERSRAMMDAYNRASDSAYQRSRDAVGDNRYNQEWNYQYGRDVIGDSRYADETKYNRGQDAQERAWREYTYKNMSASEKAQLDQASKQFGEEMAWRMFAKKYDGEISQSQTLAELEMYKQMGFNPQGGGGENQPGPESFQKNMSAAVEMGVPKEWVPLLTEIVKRESSFNPKADNPKSTAYGYGQFLNSTRQAYEKKTGLNYDNPVHQLVMMAQYVKDRYKSPEKALAFWNANHWY